MTCDTATVLENGSRVLLWILICHMILSFFIPCLSMWYVAGYCWLAHAQRHHYSSQNPNKNILSSTLLRIGKCSLADVSPASGKGVASIQKALGSDEQAESA